MGFLSIFGKQKYKPSQGRKASPAPPLSAEDALDARLESNLRRLGELLPEMEDLTVRRLRIRSTGASAALVYIEGLTSPPMRTSVSGSMSESES